MFLYRIAPVGSWAAAESASDPRLRILLSDPFETLPAGWAYGAEVSREGASLLAPVRPTKIVCVGRNYMEHAKDYGLSAKEVSFDPAAVVKRSRAVAAQLSTGVAFLNDTVGALRHLSRFMRAAFMRDADAIHATDVLL